MAQMVIGLSSSTVSLLIVKAIDLASISCEKLQTTTEAVSRDWRSCFELIPLEVELRHTEHKYASYFARSNFDESEDEEDNQWNTILGFCVHNEMSPKIQRFHDDVPFYRVALSCHIAMDIFSV